MHRASMENSTHIYLPPEIRMIVDKTASFVAKKGPEFERRIWISNVRNPKFNFLNASDPSHAYYQQKLSEYRAQSQTLSAAFAEKIKLIHEEK
ncbi:hypothetical protein QVD17_36206 [Tagetes erecta]|uniref:SURP motif domain-containing protein n=1 Tax=Tagetes erecta TaxID=13708 RepID=A0AAD8JVW4_TARER|nr:hypothetical protein QVD17_36206 [Tagetes erecta]